MGTTPSNARQRELVAEIDRWPGFTDRACLTSSDVSGIASAFRKAGENGEGDYLRREDFEHWLEMGEKPKPVQERLFEVFVVSPGETQMSLYDFTVALVNYCVDSKENLSRLAFDIYDRHTSGTITEADLEGMLIDVWGPNWEGEELARSLLNERAGMDPMQPDQWDAFCRVYPNLLHPIYKLQRTLQDFTIGRKRWVKINQRLKKQQTKMEAEHARRMADALTDEDRQQAMRAFEEAEAEASVFNGTKSQRIEAAKETANGGAAGLLPGIAVRAGASGANRAGPSLTTLTKSGEVRNRLNAARKRSTALGVTALSGDETNWDNNPLKRPIVETEEELPKFSVISRKVKVVDLGEDGGGGGGSSSRLVMTPGSNGTTRLPLGAASNRIQRQEPSLADTGKLSGSASSDRRGSVGAVTRIGGGVGYSGATLGSPLSGTRSSEASDPLQASKVGRPSSGDLQKKRSSTALVARKPSSAVNATAGAMQRKTSMAIVNASHRPSTALTSGRKPSVVVGGGATKRSSVAAYRDGRTDLLSSLRKASQQGVGASRKPSRAVVAAGS